MDGRAVRRLLIYSQDGMGLGHLRRSFNVVRELLRREPACNVLLLGDSPSMPFFAPPAGIDYVKLPTIVKTGSASWRSGALTVAVEDAVRLRARLILETFAAFRPDAVLIDHMPVGALGELKPLLDRAADARERPGLFLGLRDVLDAAEVIRRVWTGLDAYEYLPIYDAVLVYGSREVYDADEAYRLSPHAREVAFCDYVTLPPRDDPPAPRRDVPLVVVTGGGGADAFPVAETFLRALPLMGTAVRAVILTGPHMPARDRAALAEGVAPWTTVADGVQDAEGWIREADAIVTMAGYNTLCEVLTARRKALVVPRRGPSVEQRIRARLFAERGLVDVLEPELLAPDTLADRLVRLLGRTDLPDPAAIPRLDGAERAAELLLARLEVAACA